MATQEPDHKSQRDPTDQEGDACTSSTRPDLPPALGHNSSHGKLAEQGTRRCLTPADARQIQKSRHCDTAETALAS